MSVAVVLVTCGVVAGTWLLWRLPTPPAAGGVHATDVDAAAARTSIIIPARDEAASLPGLLASLRSQPQSPREIIVVDDGSTDGTAGIASDAGATVITAPPRPAGWLGKPWACHTGARHASGDRLIFLDADTRLGARGLERLLAAHRADRSAGLLSVQPFHRTRRPYEQLSAFCNVVSMMATGLFRAGSPPKRPVAFGPCLVTSAHDYHRAGGHAAVAGEIIEDIHLARAYERAGLPVRGLVGGSAISFRMYPLGLRQLVEGWSKNLSGGAFLVAPVPMVGAVLWVTACIIVATETVRAVVPAVTGGPVSWWPLAAWGAVSAQLAQMLRRIGSFRWWTVVAFPVPLAAFLLLFTRSLTLRSLRRRVTWRGRDISVGRSGG